MPGDSRCLSIQPIGFETGCYLFLGLPYDNAASLESAYRREPISPGPFVNSNQGFQR